MARIAVVEDNPHVRKLLTDMLRLRRHEPVTFEDGAQALLGVKEGGFELVISDIQMPNMDGISLCKALREVYGKGELPIILISVLSEEDDILRAFDAGANDYLTKPFSPAVVRAKVGLLLKQRRADPKGPGKPPTLAKDPQSFPFGYDKYELLGFLGGGSYGNVYRARRLLDDHVVALKLVHQQVNHDREMLARLFREIAVLSEIDVPQVVGFVDSGYERGRYFIAMDLVKGRTAAEILEERGEYPIEMVLEIGRDVCAAIGAFNAQGLVHRDIKPGNIIVKPDGGAILIDLGLAKRWNDPGVTGSDVFMGTAAYVAPEVIEGPTTGTVQSDLYSLGVTLYELLTLKRPYGKRGDPPMKILEAILYGKAAPPVHAHRDTIPRPVSFLITCLLERKPKSRLGEPGRARAMFETLLKDMNE